MGEAKTTGKQRKANEEGNRHGENEDDTERDDSGDARGGRCGSRQGIVVSIFMNMLDLFPAAGIEFVPVRSLERYIATNHRNWGKEALTASS